LQAKTGFPPLSWLNRLSWKSWLAGVLVVALAQRILLALLYAPVNYSDTAAYWRLAEAVRGGFQAYDGTRTPGYPIFLTMFEADWQVWLSQAVMGLVMTALFFYMGWELTRTAWFAGLAGLAHTLNLGQILFEPNLLSETATTFCLVGSAAGLLAWLRRPRWRTILVGLVLGIYVSLAWLTRPIFLYQPFWLFLFLLPWKFFARSESPDPAASQAPAVDYRQSLRAHVIPLAAYLLPVVLIAGTWLSWMKHTYGSYSLTVMTGYHLIQHTGLFFEYVPDEHAVLRDTFIRYRQKQIAEHGSPANAIWDAIPELQQVSGKNFYDLSDLLAEISTDLILAHPDLYLRNVVKGWWYFWRAPVYWSPDALRAPALEPLLGGLVLLSRLAVFAINLLFLALSAGAVALPAVRRRLRLPPFLWFVSGSVWGASILQTLADHGDNPRFLVPLQSLVVLFVLYCLLRLAESRPLRGSKAGAAG
jgi:hypothetical protein